MTHWITRDMGRVFPREWERFRDGVPAANCDGDLAAAYLRLCTRTIRRCGRKPHRRGATGGHARLPHPGRPAVTVVADPAFQLALSRVVIHYWAHGCFLEDGQLLRDAGWPASPESWCTGATASAARWTSQLAKVWPDGELAVVGDAGHSGGGLTPVMIDYLDGVADSR